VIKGMREQVKEAIDIELKRALKKGFVPTEAESNMRKMAEQMFNRFLHLPTQQMRLSSIQKEGACSIDAMKNIFSVDTENINFKKYKKEQHTKGYPS
jgi:glutamyl-tRNA reductase